MAFFHLHRREDKGSLGETIAANLLMQKGYKVVERNLKVNAKEIDIVAVNKEHIVFCEVKTRTSTWMGNPEENVNKQKERNMVYAANAYIKCKQETRIPRFDIIGILLHPQTQEVMEINHIENAFQPPLRTVLGASYAGRYRGRNH